MIMTRFEQQHNNKITALKSELNREVTEGFYHYKIARDAWMKVAKVLEQVQSASPGVENKKYKSVEEYEDDVLRYQMEVNHEKVSKALKEEYTEAEARHKIEAEVERMTMTETLNEEGLQRIQADAEALQLEINKLTQDIELQTQRIVELNTLIGA
uniref:Uncharacterized protein n=1 Tax=Timema poppense TaxID=170557 RepID=A0A7R9DJ62_TIMPO|nr:unnamed protein product [Timema poppensis]